MNKANNKIVSPSANTELVKNTDTTCLQSASGKSNVPKPEGTQSASNNNELREPKPGTKASMVVKKLHSARGATIEALVQLTGWQPHSVRGFLSGTVRKRFGLNLISYVGKDGNRRYRIEERADK